MIHRVEVRVAYFTYVHLPLAGAQRRVLIVRPDCEMPIIQSNDPDMPLQSRVGPQRLDGQNGCAVFWKPSHVKSVVSLATYALYRQP